MNKWFDARIFFILKQVLKLSFFLVALCGVGRIFYWAKDGFDIRRIGQCSNVDTNREKISEEMIQILNQPFIYLSRGRQSFAFQSQDGQYVLKFPRIDRYNTKLWIRTFPFFKDKVSKSMAHKKMRSTFVFNSFEIAYRELKEETGVLYLHLEKTEGLPTISIRDRIGETFKISLNQTIFILQKKFPMGFPQLIDSLNQKRYTEAKEMIDRFLDLCVARAKKGIFNRDSNFLMNFAYDGVKFIQIDVGSFHQKPYLSHAQATQGSYSEATEQFKFWLNDIDPEICCWIDQRIEKRRCDL